MSIPNSRELFKDYILRKIGAPVIEINVAEEQVEDRIDEAVSFWRDYHYNGSQQVYLKHKITASIVNFFISSSLMHYIISIIGVLVFTGLTAYDVQKIKNIGSQVQEGSESAQKLMIMGALTLYLDFINLFLMMLRLFGNRD